MQADQRQEDSPFPYRLGQRDFAARGQPVQRSISRRIWLGLETFHLTTNFVVGRIETGEEIPEAIAVVVKRLGAGTDEGRLDFSTLKWMPYVPTVPIDLGPGDGQRMIWIAARWDRGSFQQASGTRVEVLHTPPLIVITNPTEHVTSRPMIQLQGYSVRDLRSIRYDVLNASNRVENEMGFVNHSEIDFTAVGLISTNYFTCYDIELSVGTNTIVLRCEDNAGNVATQTLTYVLDLEHDKVPPVISPDWPLNGTKIIGSAFTARGRLDDPTARITGEISAAGGHARVIDGLVERSGYFWIEDLPLSLGTNLLSLTATDAAGNRASTNYVVVGGEGTVLMDPISPEQLWLPAITVTGKVDPPDRTIWVNGVLARVDSRGAWIATNVPVLSPNGNTACFDIKAIPPRQNSTVADRPRELVSVQSSLQTNAVVLNASLPACGIFKLHLTATAGRSFILLASTNLEDWVPILTNLDSGAAFDYTDTNVAGQGCRFFRVIPNP
jgi:hypothetical protein